MITGLTTGHLYEYRASAVNRVGEGALSPYSAQIKAAQAPSAPEAPIYSASTATTITLELTPASDNGGDTITEYHIYADDGNLATTLFTDLTSYDGVSMTYVLDNTVEVAYLTGSLYRFYVTVENSIGESDPSSMIRVALAELPAQPIAPTIDVSRSTTTSLYVQWTAVTGGSISTLGYKLYMSAAGQGSYSLAYDGSLNSATLSYSVNNLNTGEYYSFYVVAVNYNGESPISSELQAPVCVAPQDLSPPYYIASTTSTITLGWTSPADDGGCPIITYELYMNDGLGGATTTQVDPVSIDNKPYLTQFQVTTGLSLVGNPYNFNIRAYNELDYVESEDVSIVLAATPDTPLTAPTQDYSETTSD
mmetsp:Transcript_30242/g.29560  ORF Transcript_30242/g.29560 Transcript_30242/m.29560 type:complete len:364 (+) Transcript_30242:1022-2113(+)